MNNFIYHFEMSSSFSLSFSSILCLGFFCLPFNSLFISFESEKIKEIISLLIIIRIRIVPKLSLEVILILQ